MKIAKEAALFQVPFGSHLYGTSTPTSDLDAKVVALPSFEDLIMLRRIENTVVKPEGYIEGSKMQAGDMEYEIVPLQIFLDHFYEGQTYALEIAFAVLSDMHITLEYEYGKLSIEADSTFIKSWMQTLVDKYLTSDIKKMVGYARSQSQLYGLKTERYNEMLRIQKMLYTVVETKKLHETPDFLKAMLENKYVTEVQIMNGQGGKVAVPGIELNGKQFPLTSTWKTVLASVTKTLSSYGNRVKDHTDKPTDWKALSHAIRIGEQILEVLQEGKMSFPRPNAKYLLEVKQGKVPLEEATNYLTELFNQVEGAVESSTLPNKDETLADDFEMFKLDLLMHYYKLKL